MSETEQTKTDYSRENEAGKQLEAKIEMLYQQRAAFPKGSTKIAAYDLKIQSHLLNLKLLQNIFSNVIRTVLNVNNYNQLNELKEEIDFGLCFMETYESVMLNFKSEKGSFIKYFTSSFKNNVFKAADLYKKNNIKHGIVGINSKNVSVKSLDAPLKDDEKQTFGDTIASNDKSDGNNQQEDEVVDKLFSEIDNIYNETKAGQANKSIAYTSKVIDYLLSLPKEKIEQTISKYNFLKPQKDIILYLFQITENTKNHIPQKMFAKLCNARTEVICRLSTALVERLKESFSL
ncbi:MAG: hypothetical protein K6G09_01465 [Treponema sp.]|nr:hypothetical protein [Treponema sp.]